jgi:hypothetical protein
MEKSKWFDMKLLIDLQGFNNTKSLKNWLWAKAIKTVLDYLRILALKLVYLGRNLSCWRC